MIAFGSNLVLPRAFSGITTTESCVQPVPQSVRLALALGLLALGRGRLGQLVSDLSPDGGALLRVIAGEVAGHRGPGITYTPISLLHDTLAPGALLRLPCPADFNALLYVLAGAGSVGAERRPIHMGQLAAYGPFVMNTRDELPQAFED